MIGNIRFTNDLMHVRLKHMYLVFEIRDSICHHEVILKFLCKIALVHGMIEANFIYCLIKAHCFFKIGGFIHTL